MNAMLYRLKSSQGARKGAVVFVAITLLGLCAIAAIVWVLRGPASLHEPSGRSPESARPDEASAGNPNFAARQDAGDNVGATWSYDFAAPNAGEWRTDSKTEALLPFYDRATWPNELTQPPEARVVEMDDSPFIPFRSAFAPYSLGPPAADKIVFDFTIDAKLFAVWVFDDDTVYPIGGRTWAVRIHWTVVYSGVVNGIRRFVGSTRHVADDKASVDAFILNQTSRWSVGNDDFVADAPAAADAAAAFR